MGTCSTNHVEDVSIDTEKFINMQSSNSYIPRMGNNQFCLAFNNCKLTYDPIEEKDLEVYEKFKGSLQEKCGHVNRSSQIDSKFLGMSLCLGPFYNLSKSMFYLGSIKDDLPHGWGEVITKDGLYYIGYFDEGIPNYYGKYLCSDGTTYEGGLYKTTKDGYGKLTLPNGAVQEGEWKFNSLFYSNTSTKRPQIAQKERDFDDLGYRGTFASYTSAQTAIIPPIGDFSPPFENFRITPQTTMGARAIKSEPQIKVLGQIGSSNLKSCIKTYSEQQDAAKKNIRFAHPLEQPRS